ncbi:MAG: hypothetical protein KGP28_10900 [Bdellovibrionales bacterium]|nr:hypothetical protein [Bdellovibrionales bacterium]
MRRLPVLAIITVFLAKSALAADPYSPPKTFDEIIGSFHKSHFQHKPAIRVTTARVLFADYDLIRRDFEVTRTMSELEMDAWLIDSAACISRDQIEVGTTRGVNSAIEHDPKELRSSLRPPNYGRAIVIEVPGGILDAKGAGGVAQAISQNSHRNGLLETAEAIREFSYSKLVQKALYHAGSDFRAIDSYAVIDFGFLMKSSVDETMQPAGLLLRQSHFRDITRSEQLEQTNALKIERSLREFGITTAYKKTSLESDRSLIYDVLNVQGSDEGHFLYDFGGYRISDHFTNQAITLSDLFQKKIIPVFKDPISATPRVAPKYAPLFQAWGGEGSEERIWKRAREIAAQFKLDGDSDETRRAVNALLETTNVIPSEPPRGPGTCVESLKRP